jgi:hypothetical protein
MEAEPAPEMLYSVKVKMMDKVQRNPKKEEYFTKSYTIIRALWTWHTCSSSLLIC